MYVNSNNNNHENHLVDLEMCVYEYIYSYIYSRIVCVAIPLEQIRFLMPHHRILNDSCDCIVLLLLLLLLLALHSQVPTLAH